MIQQVGEAIVAIQISEGSEIAAGEAAFRGTYSSVSFAIEEDCGGATRSAPNRQPANLGVVDEMHIKITGGCDGNALWTRSGPITLAIDSTDLFEFNRPAFAPTSERLLQRIAEMLKASHPAARLLVAGYTDNQGTAEHNLQLSTHRARAIALWLEARSITPSRITAKGFGANNPRYPNTTDVGRARNRRIEIVVEPQR